MGPVKRKGPPTEEKKTKRLRKSELESAKENAEKLPPSLARPTKLSILGEEEPAFPRGGASILTPLEHKQIQIDATRDVLFEQSASRKPGGAHSDSGSDGGEANGASRAPKKQKTKRAKKDKKANAKVEEEENSVRIESLSYKRTAPGTLVLGQISQLNDHDIALALPNNLTGYIPLTAISDQLDRKLDDIMRAGGDSGSEDSSEDDVDLKSYFSIGQYLRAYVFATSEDTGTTAKGKKRIELSIHPRLANRGLSKQELVINSMVQASVTSVEDHGLVMDLGLDDPKIRGFMSSKEVGHNVDHSQIREGAVFLCLVTGLSSNGNIVKLSADAQKAGNLKKSNLVVEAPTVDAFLPGTAVELLVSEVRHDGIVGKIMGMLDVTADLIHSGGATSGKDLDGMFRAGDKIKGRIIFTCPNSDPKKLAVSTRQHILSLTPMKAFQGKDTNEKKEPTEMLPISSIIEETKVAKVESNVGLFVDVGVKGVPGFVHISRISDRKIESLSESTGPYKLGSVHRARVIGYNPMDGIFLVSMEQKILDQPFLRVEDIEVGQVVKGRVEKLIINAAGAAGVLINLAEGISGMVPEMHMSDVKLLHPERKFKEGVNVTARVLSTDPSRRQFRLTLKKTLVHSEAPVFKTYEEVTAGSQCPGTIVKILTSGAVVQFYGYVRGFLPVSEMSEAYIQDPSQHFRIGQVVNVHVISVDAADKKLQVSCKDPSAFGLAQQAASRKLKVGEIVHGSVLEKSGGHIVVELEGSGLKAILLLAHLTDGSEKKDMSTFKKIRVGQMLRDLVVLEKAENKRLITLTSKPSLVEAASAGKLLTQFDDIKEGNLVSGFVKNITLSGVFVQFAGGLTGLIPKRFLPEETAPLPNFGLRQFQSISATVQSVQHDLQRFLLKIADNEKPKEVVATTTDVIGGSSRPIINAVDGESTSIDDFVFGKLTKAKIASVKATQINVRLADNIPGRIDMSQMFDSWDEIVNKKSPLRKFSAREVLPVRVMGIHDARNHRFLPISHRGANVPTFELTAKPTDLQSVDLDVLTLDKVKSGSSWIAFVNNVGNDYLWVNISPNIRGRIRALDLSDDVSLLNNLDDNFPVGSALKVHVINVDPEKNRLDLSARSTPPSVSLTHDQLAKGMVLPARVSKVTERYLVVHLSESMSGQVDLINLADDYSEAHPTKYTKNEIVGVCVIDLDIPKKRKILSMRPSRVLSSSLLAKDPEIMSLAQVKVNDTVRGFVKNIADSGLFVTIGPNVTAYVRITDLSDSFIKDWKAAFEIDQLITGKVIAVDPLLNHVQMSLKRSVIDKDYVPLVTFHDIKVGQVVTGKVRKVEEFGVFIVLDGSANVSGLCHRSEMANKNLVNPKKLYEEGDLVKAKVLKIELEKRRINFGLKASYFKEGGKNGEVDGDDSEVADGGEVRETSSADEDGSSEEGGVDLENVKDFESDEEGGHDEKSDSDEEMDNRSATKDKGGLSAGGFDWTASILDQGNKRVISDSESGSDVEKPKKKRRKPEIKLDRTGELDANGPQSITDFERLLLGQPNSSYLWLSYMAFQLQLSEVAKAREIAERAIQTMNIREESEKMNVWIGLLNLENTYGSDETIDEAFKRASQYNDAQEIHERLTSIFIQSGKNEKADALFQTMIKKFSQSPRVWLNYATFLFDNHSSPASARALLSRATQALPTHTHLDLTSKFAQLEFKCRGGDPERGRTIFEGLLTTFPKRLDIWSVLLDLEVKQGDQEQVRRIFGRVLGLGLRAKKAKFFFKRWLEIEEKWGDGKSVDAVKAKAAEYVKGVAAGEHDT
ncbi:MAG: rRNA biogenesis protein rrp5 [Geoglossum umbratile]|nr:MAG: rRNA biogenesis protein rrp5 [Geoglossum umbratile]